MFDPIAIAAGIASLVVLVLAINLLRRLYRNPDQSVSITRVKYRHHLVTVYADKKQPPLSGGCWRIGSMFDRYENNFCTMFPLRTSVIGRPVLVSYSIVGSMPRL